MPKQIKAFRRAGILTGGGDCPGLNAVIRAVVKTAMIDYDASIIGFEDGYEGLIKNNFRKLSYQDVSGILTLGGTILGTSNKSSPFKKTISPSQKIRMTSNLRKTIHNIKKHNLDVLFCVGGDGTLSIGEALSRIGLPIIGIPKTIDNDLSGTDVTFGFNTAYQIACDAIDRLHSTAMSHHRAMIVEVMGRYAGWLALYSGIAGGGDIILIPEIPYKLNAVCQRVVDRHKRGKRFSIIVIAEGAKEKGRSLVLNRTIKGSPDPIRLGGVGRLLGNQIEKKTGLETRVTTLGHLQRGGTPTAFDRILATQFGVEAVRIAANKEYGRMVALQGTDITSIPLNCAVSSLKHVQPDHPLIVTAQSVGTSFGV